MTQEQLLAEVTGLRSSTSSAELHRLSDLVMQLLELFDDDARYVHLWLTSPHPDLGGRPPLDFLEEDRFEVIETLAHMIETGQPG